MSDFAVYTMPPVGFPDSKVHEANLGPVGPDGPHEPCYQG